MPNIKTRNLYNNTIKIDFIENPYHKYIVNGQSGIISVTAVTGVLDKPALKFWSVKLMKQHLEEFINNTQSFSLDTLRIQIEEASNAHTRKMQKEATSGSLVHEWAEAYILNQLEKKPKPEMPKDERVLNGVIAFLKWVEEHRVKFLASELLLYSRKHGYAGLMDAKAKIKNRIYAIDFKTSSGVYPEFFMQLAGYRGADEEESNQKYEGSIIINFSKDTGEFKSYHSKNHKAEYQAFLGLLKTKKWLKDFKVDLN